MKIRFKFPLILIGLSALGCIQSCLEKIVDLLWKYIENIQFQMFKSFLKLTSFT